MTSTQFETGFELGDSESREPIRAGFGRGLLAAGQADSNVVALCADLTESTQMHLFRDAFPDRFIQVGVAEQNLVTVASGLAAMGKVPFTSSYAAFSPGRNWEQIKTTACLNDVPVVVVGSHAGLNVGPDGATHQMLEDLALMRVLPNMVVIAPGDAAEAAQATRAVATLGKPSYLRLARDATASITTAEHRFRIGRAYVVKEGSHLTMCGTGTMTHHLMQAALTIESSRDISVEVIHVPTVKPLDEDAILSSVRKTGLIVTAEEAQIAGGFGGAIAELLGREQPTRMHRLGVDDRYGQSGTPDDVLRAYGLDAAAITQSVLEFLDRQAGDDPKPGGRP